MGNSTLLQGDAAEAVARLQEKSDLDPTVLGSGVLVQSLMARDLVNEYLFTIHRLALGSGRRSVPRPWPAGEVESSRACRPAPGS